MWYSPEGKSYRTLPEAQLAYKERLRRSKSGEDKKATDEYDRDDKDRRKRDREREKEREHEAERRRSYSNAPAPAASDDSDLSHLPAALVRVSSATITCSARYIPLAHAVPLLQDDAGTRAQHSAPRERLVRGGQGGQAACAALPALRSSPLPRLYDLGSERERGRDGYTAAPQGAACERQGGQGAAAAAVAGGRTRSR